MAEKNEPRMSKKKQNRHFFIAPLCVLLPVTGVLWSRNIRRGMCSFRECRSKVEAVKSSLVCLPTGLGILVPTALWQKQLEAYILEKYSFQRRRLSLWWCKRLKKCVVGEFESGVHRWTSSMIKEQRILSSRGGKRSRKCISQRNHQHSTFCDRKEPKEMKLHKKTSLIHSEFLFSCDSSSVTEGSGSKIV